MGDDGADPDDEPEAEDHRQARLFTDDTGEYDADRSRDEALPVEDGEVVDVENLADHQTYVEGRGIYDERNRVNDLTGREWKYATKSVIAQQYPPDCQHDLRRDHGGQKPPRLCADLIGRFSKAGDTVLDPFAGVGGTLLGASICEHEGTGLRDAIGFEVNGRWVGLYEEVLERENADREEENLPPLARQDVRHGDCRVLASDLDDGSVDLLLTDVPYWTMDKVEQTRNEARTRDSSLGAFDRADDDPTDATLDQWSQEVTDVGELQSKAAWLEEMADTFARLERVLREDAYAVVFIGDMYRGGSYELLHADLANAIRDATDLTLKANLVWYDPSKDLHVYGYPFSFVPSMVHQNVLVFRNESE